MGRAAAARRDAVANFLSKTHAPLPEKHHGGLSGAQLEEEEVEALKATRSGAQWIEVCKLIRSRRDGLWPWDFSARIQATGLDAQIAWSQWEENQPVKKTKVTSDLKITGAKKKPNPPGAKATEHLDELVVLVRAWLEAHPIGRCGICNAAVDSSSYAWLVCATCDARSVTAEHRPARDSGMDNGDNPVFIDGIRCWRRYKFGGHVTMRDVPNAPTHEAFHAATVAAMGTHKAR